MIRRVLAATRLVLLVQARGYFPHTFALFVGMVVGVLLFVVPEGIAQLILPVFLVTEPGMLGLMAVAAHRYLELGSASVSALHVSPLRSGEYLVALLSASALLGTAAGVVTFAAVAGVDGRLVGLTLVLFAFAFLSGLLGFALSLRYPDFPRFLLGSIPAMVVWQLPLLAAFDLAPAAVVVWLPSAAGILALAELCRGDLSLPATAGWVLAGGAWAGAAFVLVQRLYARRLRSGWELA